MTAGCRSIGLLLWLASAAQPAEEATTILARAQALRDEQNTIASQLLAQFPGDFDALRVMGYAHSSQGNLTEMAACWEKCRELQPNRPDIHDQLGRYSMNVERYADAVAAWRRALEIDPKFPGVQQRIAAALLAQSLPTEARAALERQLVLTPDDSQSHFLLGEALFQLQEFAAAKASYLRAVELDAKHAQAYYGLIKCSARLGASDEAARYATKFQELEAAGSALDQKLRREYDDLGKMQADLVVTCIDAGRVYSRAKMPRQAEPLWARAVELDRQNETAHQLLATMYVQERRGEEAVQQFEQLARINPRGAEYQRQLGFLYARLNKLPAAEAAFQRLVELAPNDGGAHRALAKFYLNTNRQPQRAGQLALRALELEPVADSYFVLGWAHAKLGKPAEARQALSQALRLEPDNATYRKLYESLQRQAR